MHTPRLPKFHTNYFCLNSRSISSQVEEPEKYRKCLIVSPEWPSLRHSSHSPMSLRHSIAAMLFICARGVSAVLGAALITNPEMP